MSSKEKRPIVSIIINLLTFGTYYFFVLKRYQGHSFETLEEVKFWATVILILVPILIVAKIVLYVIYSIFNTIITGQEEDTFKLDEFENLIESRSTRNFYTVFAAGFLLSLLAPVFDFHIMVMFNVQLFAIIIAGICLDLSQMYYERKGI